MVSNQIKLNSMVNKAPRRCIIDGLIFLSVSWFNLVQSPRIIIIPYVVFLATNLLSGAHFDDDKENRESLLMYHVLSKKI